MNQIAPRETSINSVSVSTGANGTSIAPQNLGEVVRFAEVMCKADIALPKHLRGNAGACMAVAMQALEWQMSPFAVASKSYAVNGAIAYEAQLIAAVVNTRSGIKGRLKYVFEGTGAAMTCTVTRTLDGEECVYTSPSIGSITTKNSPLWKSDPQQQLGYFSARSWARRHCPEVLLGVYDRDEAEQFQGADNAKDVTPRTTLQARLAAAKEAHGEQEGFNAANVARETGTLTGGVPEQNSETSADDLPTKADAGSDIDAIAPNERVASAHLTDDESALESSGDDVASPSSSLDSEIDDFTEQTTGRNPSVIRELKRECKDKLLQIANSDLPAGERRGVLERTKNVWKDELPEGLEFVRICFETTDKVIKKELTSEFALKYLNGLVGAI